MRTLAVATVLIMTFTPHVQAQSEREPQVGELIRIQIAGSKVEYKLQRIGPDTLYVSRPYETETWPIAAADVEKVEVKAPRPAGTGAWRGALIGGAIGAGVGMIYAIATWDEGETECGDFTEVCSNTTSSMRLVGYVGIIGIVGILAGTVVGSAAPGQQWVPVDTHGATGLHFDTDRGLFARYVIAF